MVVYPADGVRLPLQEPGEEQNDDLGIDIDLSHWYLLFRAGWAGEVGVRSPPVAGRRGDPEVSFSSVTSVARKRPSRLMLT